MKKTFVLLGMMFVALLSFGFKVGATEPVPTDVVVVSDDLPEAGLTPENALYGLDKFFENVALRFTFSNEKRAEKLSKIAEERLAELNALDPEKATVYADELFNEYGLSLEKANLYVQQLVSEGKISEERLARIETRVAKAEERQERISDRIKEKISIEVKSRVADAIKNAKMSIFNQFTDQEKITSLHEQGYGYGDLLKLQAISDLTSKSMDELLLLENVVTTNENNEKVVNFDQLLQVLELTREDLRAQLNQYRENAKSEMRTRIEEMKKQAETRREEIKNKMTERIHGRR